MLCQKCNKNKASVYYNKIVNGEKTEMYLCSECAKENTEMNFNLDMPFSMMDIFSNLGFQPKKELEEKLVCPNAIQHIVSLRIMGDLDVVNVIMHLVVK
ncbi:putative modulator of CtsR repression McsA [Clostridioides difficile CD45]|uniref:hypothetical protein n=1 Tax=Clostridioides difficile TaxID=1496 RepID=UPI00038C7764|nr:hypothetical protein [Clostridioides difficile]EQE70965.1 putative modulator of CtsR repression McsA [Clostridioides difficile CD45]